MIKRTLSALLPLCIFLCLAGCKKYLDINDNPNSPTEASITPDLILPRVQNATAARMATSFDWTAGWIGYWARSAGNYGPNSEQESYNITTTFEPTNWSGWYDILNDAHLMEIKAKASGQTFYEGIAKTMKVIGFMHLVDMYNNVPYSKAFDLLKNVQPAYDKGADIYADLFVQLDAAQDLIKNAAASNNLRIADADVMFKGNALQWRRFINTMRLKLAVRQSQVPGYNPAGVLAKVAADGSGFIGAGQTAYVQPGYFQDNGKQNPFWNEFELNFVGEAANDYWRANNFALNLYVNNNDPRYQRIYDAARTPLGGVAYRGFDYGDPATGQPDASQSSNVAGPGLATSAGQAQWVLTSVESLFLQAEATQRGWISGNAQSVYEAAVRESFAFLGVPNAVTSANTYLASGSSIVDWTSATNKVNLIVTQKYLALNGINNFEAWVDYRRLGVPNVPKSLAPNTAANIPVRLRYPQDEYNYNAANVAAEQNPNPFTSGVFWDR